MGRGCGGWGREAANGGGRRKGDRKRRRRWGRGSVSVTFLRIRFLGLKLFKNYKICLIIIQFYRNNLFAVNYHKKFINH